MPGSGESGDVTLMLRALARGERAASEALLQRVYDELRTLAAARMAHERPGHTFQPTALVHEAWLRLVGDRATAWEGRAHFYGAAAEAMRRILVDHARRRGAAKRGGGARRQPLSDGLGAEGPRLEEIVAVDEALSRMEERNPRGAAVVRLRFFAGLDEEEIARVLEVSTRTVRREWLYARARLFRELNPDADGEEGSDDPHAGNGGQGDLRARR